MLLLWFVLFICCAKSKFGNPIAIFHLLFDLIERMAPSKGKLGKSSETLMMALIVLMKNDLVPKLFNLDMKCGAGVLSH